MSPSQQQYRNALTVILSNPLLRVWLYRIIAEDCKVFCESFPVNASAYCLLAKQEIGKRLLADAKDIDLDAVFAAEREYGELMTQNEAYIRLHNHNEGEDNGEQ